MGAAELLRWQWEGYPRYHRSRFKAMLLSSWHWWNGRGRLESSPLSRWFFPLRSRAAVTVKSQYHRSPSLARSMRCRESS
jgi:hypothetical protein